MDQGTVLQEVQNWSEEDQLEFVFRVWDQLVDSGWKPKLTDDLKAELDCRLATHEADPTRVLTWEQLVARVKGRQ